MYSEIGTLNIYLNSLFFVDICTSLNYEKEITIGT